MLSELLISPNFGVHIILISPFIDKPYQARVIESQRRAVDALTVGIVAHAEDFRLLRVIDVQRKVIARKHPIELRRDHTRERDFHRCHLSLQLVLRIAFPCIDKRREVVFQFGIR